MSNKIKKDVYKDAYTLMCTARAMTHLFEENKEVTSKYVHATSAGHEAIQLAVGMQLTQNDWASPYYRDDAMLLGIGITPHELMLQLLCKKDDPFSGGRTYYSHPSLKREGFPKIPHQSSATGMQAIPTTGVAMGIQYKEMEGLSKPKKGEESVVVCSFGDASITEGEVAEAFQMAALKKLPILYLVQDNEWDISAHASETRAVDATHYAKGFGLKTYTIDGTDFTKCYETIQNAFKEIRNTRSPILIHAKVPLLNHHTSGVRMEWYRDDLEESKIRDPLPKLREELLKNGFSENELSVIEKSATQLVKDDYKKALKAEDPKEEDLYTHNFAPTTILKEKGERTPKDKETTVMVDSALFAIKELMSDHPESLLYGQDVGKRLGGVFREAATLAETYGDNRVFNTPIQEAFIIGSTVGMSAVGLKPIVEVQFADYIWPGLNQLFTEVSRSNYLSNGKWPVSCIIRVPIGAYGSGGPYHSSSVESVLSQIKGIKIAYPSNGADLKGLMKSAFYDPNPVVILEHKGLYWSKIKGTDSAKTIEPDKDYIIPFGKARVALSSDKKEENTICIITYGMGVHWALNAAKDHKRKVEIIDLRTINPIDEDLIFSTVNKHGKCLVLTEEPYHNSFAQSLTGRIQEKCFKKLDAPVFVMGSENLPAIPLNSTLEAKMLPNAEKASKKIGEILNY
ncbi:MAG: thiamine pyrophosphate-dependent enzyme [Flavobacteriales bacterium]|jgi:2-oxoisovalerate dehydrogenase E1 component|nr:thiamine pyrophosphate-dependent enzyme [Flavobacteriales bacterium]